VRRGGHEGVSQQRRAETRDVLAHQRGADPRRCGTTRGGSGDGKVVPTGPQAAPHWALLMGLQTKKNRQ
jgi:hypothetical protein